MNTCGDDAEDLRSVICFTSYFDVANHCGRVFGISQTQPRGYEFPTFHDLVPPADLVWSFKRGEVSWEAYRPIYWSHLGSRSDAIVRWIEWVPPTEFTLCCWERSADRCHRSIAAEFLADLGYPVHVV